MVMKPGFAFPAIDALQVLVDDEIRPFTIDTRYDLTATGAQACPVISNGVFIVHERVVPSGQTRIIFGVFPHLWERTGVGMGDESFQLIQPDATAGFVLFDWMKQTNQPFRVETDYNRATTLAGAQNSDRTQSRGSTWASTNQPLYAGVTWQNPLQTVHLAQGSTFRVTFQLMPQSPVNPIPNPYVIGNPGPNGNKRIDFAGADVHGVEMPEAVYNKLKKARLEGQLGSEASAWFAPPGTLPGSGPLR